jgi:hypothetical protein
LVFAHRLRHSRVTEHGIDGIDAAKKTALRYAVENNAVGAIKVWGLSLSLSLSLSQLAGRADSSVSICGGIALGIVLPCLRWLHQVLLVAGAHTNTVPTELLQAVESPTEGSPPPRPSGQPSILGFLNLDQSAREVLQTRMHPQPHPIAQLFRHLDGKRTHNCCSRCGEACCTVFTVCIVLLTGRTMDCVVTVQSRGLRAVGSKGRGSTRTVANSNSRLSWRYAAPSSRLDSISRSRWCGRSSPSFEGKISSR